MFTRKALDELLTNFLKEFVASGYKPVKVILFGSYAYGRPNELSDVDLAIWDKKFIGVRSVDVEPFASLLSKYNSIQIHTFPLAEGSLDPFEDEILSKGIDLTAKISSLEPAR